MTMWAARGSVSNSSLFEINPSTGATITTVGSIGEGITGMAIDPTNGTLYGVTSNTSTNFRYLVTINKVTAAATLVGQLLSGGVRRTVADIGFDSTGQLWGFNATQGRICQINKATGALTNIGASGGGSGNGFDLDWEDNAFWLPEGDEGGLYQIDTTTGVDTLISTLADLGNGSNYGAACFAGDTFYAILNDTPSILVSIDYYGTGTTIIGTMDEDELDALASDVTKAQWYSPPIEIDAEDYAIVGGTVSLEGGSPQWVRDVQYREYDFVNFDSSKGVFDYTPTLSIPAGTVPAGRWQLEIYSRAGSIAAPSTQSLLCQIENGGEKMNPQFDDGFFGTGPVPLNDGDEEWRRLTDPSGNGTIFGQGKVFDGGPLYVDTSKEIKIAIGQGDEAESSPGVAERYLEVQKLRFTPITVPALRSRRWRNMQSGSEPFRFMIEGQTRVKTDPNDPTKCWVLTHLWNNISGNQRYTLWQYEINGDQISLVDPKGLGDTTILLETNSATYWHDFTIMPNGDIYVVTCEADGSTAFVTNLQMWDGATWNVLDSDLGGHGGFSVYWPTLTCSIDNDGTDVYVAWGETKNGAVFPEPWGIRIKKYDVGGASFTELGTGSGNGLTAYPANYAAGSPRTDAGDDRNGLKLRCAPDGTPWLMWAERDNTSPGTYPTRNEYPFIRYWDGATWQDTGYAPPATAPPDIGVTHTYSPTPSFGNNYTGISDDPQDPFDMIFFKADGSSSNYPSIVHEYDWSDEVGNIDWAEYVYSEYNGSTWSTHVRLWPKQQWTAMHDLFQVAGYYGTHWAGGMKLLSDGGSTYFIMQCAQSGSSLIDIGAARLLPDGSAWESLGGDENVSTDPNGFETLERNLVGTPTDPQPYNSGGNWIDVIEPGVLLNGRPVGIFHWPNGYMREGIMLTLWMEAGGNVSMNWRSADRRGAANRVLIGR